MVSTTDRRGAFGPLAIVWACQAHLSLVLWVWRKWPKMLLKQEQCSDQLNKGCVPLGAYEHLLMSACAPSGTQPLVRPSTRLYSYACSAWPLWLT